MKHNQMKTIKLLIAYIKKLLKDKKSRKKTPRKKKKKSFKNVHLLQTQVAK